MASTQHYKYECLFFNTERAESLQGIKGRARVYYTKNKKHTSYESFQRPPLIRKIRLSYLIRSHATGSPKELAQRLELSERQIFRLIQKMKDIGFPIIYCKSQQCYYYDGEVKIRFEVVINQEKTIQIKGGNKFNVFSTLTKNGSASPYIVDDYMSTIYQKGDTENPAGLFSQLQ